ncbi:hypothetical protein EJF36_13200 [Bacillus sp. HMF5848]|uniref:hypothetical protein n=1 Tax=Bacillus sp. HMF5848 TaxID=2495421 RepID=UPI000F78376B|nr:hypothetical protein [Bacillus sp. HMF5848]RSK27753.1 hypothetical protein EJF36_13200 [Bacillus sp. HMF5848]
MAKDLYTDYINKVVLSIPDSFIDVKTGETVKISPKIKQQIEYHTTNQTLMHLIYSSLNQYFKPRKTNIDSQTILQEIYDLKKLIQQPGYVQNQSEAYSHIKDDTPKDKDLNLDDVCEILEAFSG